MPIVSFEAGGTASRLVGRINSVGYRASILFAFAPLLAGAGCQRGPATPRQGTSVGVTASALDGLYKLQERIPLQQPDSALIVRVSGIDRRADGAIALGDASEGNVKLYSPSGRLLRVIGRKGQGPGEFQEPRFPRFGENHRLYVADGAGGRVSIFDSAGTLLRTLQLGRATFLMGFEIIPNGGGFLFSSEDADGYVLFRTDSTGKPSRRFLRIRDTHPRDQPAESPWRSVRGFSIALHGDTAFVVCTLSDSLWTVNLRSGVESAVRLSLPDYKIPVPPAQPLTSMAELMKWSRSLQLAVSMTASDSTLLINFTRGVLSAGDPNTAAIRSADGRWNAVSQAPAFLRGVGPDLLALASAGDSSSGAVVLGVYGPALGSRP